MHVLEVARGLARARPRGPRGRAPRRRRGARARTRRRALAPRRLVAAASLLPLPRAARGGARWRTPCARTWSWSATTTSAARGSRPPRARGVPGLLEVNSPVVDHPGSLKAALDAALVVRPLRRYREAMVRAGDRARGADPGDRPRVRPRAHGDRDLGRERGGLLARRGATPRCARRSGVPEGAVAVLFSGSFRPWHGVHVLEDGGAPAARIAPTSSSCSRAAAAPGRRRRLPRPPAGRRALRATCPRWSPPATSASRPTTPRACASCASASSGRR